VCFHMHIPGEPVRRRKASKTTRSFLPECNSSSNLDSHRCLGDRLSSIENPGTGTAWLREGHQSYSPTAVVLTISTTCRYRRAHLLELHDMSPGFAP
jgi:hypothetical protein